MSNNAKFIELAQALSIDHTIERQSVIRLVQLGCTIFPDQDTQQTLLKVVDTLGSKPNDPNTSTPTFTRIDKRKNLVDASIKKPSAALSQDVAAKAQKTIENVEGQTAANNIGEGLTGDAPTDPKELAEQIFALGGRDEVINYLKFRKVNVGKTIKDIALKAQLVQQLRLDSKSYADYLGTKKKA